MWCSKIAKNLSELIPDGIMKEKIMFRYYKLTDIQFKIKISKLKFKLKNNTMNFEYLAENFRIKINKKTYKFVRFIWFFINDDFSRYLRYYVPREGDIVFDLGGYLGEFSFYLSHLVGNKGKFIVLNQINQTTNL